MLNSLGLFCVLSRRFEKKKTTGVNLPVINKDRLSWCQWWCWLHTGGFVDACSCLPSTSGCSITPLVLPYLFCNPAEGGLLGNSLGWQRALTLILSRGGSSIFLFPQSPLLYLSPFLSLAPGTNKYLSSLLIKQKEEEHKGKLTTSHPQAELAHVYTHTQAHRVKPLKKIRHDACDLRGPLHAGSGCTSKLFINKSS